MSQKEAMQTSSHLTSRRYSIGEMRSRYITDNLSERNGSFGCSPYLPFYKSMRLVSLRRTTDYWQDVALHHFKIKISLEFKEPKYILPAASAVFGLLK